MGKVKRSKDFIVRLDPETHAKLLELSKVLNVSASTVSYTIIKAAIDEAEKTLDNLAVSLWTSGEPPEIKRTYPDKGGKKSHE